MPLWLRRIIYYSFIAVFLIVAPLLALYSMGYRYHWVKHRLERTGLIIIDGEPRDATVAVDGAIRSARLPARIGGLGPNVYTVRIEREGYLPWERRLMVESGRTTSVMHALLFRALDPAHRVSGSVTNLAVSANNRWAAYTRAFGAFSEVWLLNCTTGERTLVMRIGVTGKATQEHPIALTWSPRGAALLITTPTDTLLMDPREPTTHRSLRSALGRMPTAIQWELASDDAIIALAESRLYRIHRTTWRAVPLPIAVPVHPFAVGRDVVYTSRPYQGPQGAGTEVLAIPTDGGEPRSIAGIIGGTLTRFTDLRGTTLIGEQQARPGVIHTVILNTAARQQPAVRSGTGRIAHPDDPHAVAWRTDANELWVERGDDTQPELLVRRDTPIGDIRWHPEQPYLFFATHTAIIAVALDTPTPERTTTLATFDAIRHLVIRTDGDALFIVGRRGSEEGLWELPLQ